ncbi:MAG: YcnI family protein [Rhodospirillales bacterium]
MGAEHRGGLRATAKRRAVLAAVPLAVGFVAAADAHVLLKEDSAEAGSRHVAVFVLQERCGESRTKALRITMPDGVYVAQPAAKQGWRLDVVEEALAQPVTAGGENVSKRVKEIAWTIASPRPAYVDQFEVALQLPAAAGTLYFLSVQECETGERRWVEIPPAGKTPADLRRPAPALTVTPRR